MLNDPLQTIKLPTIVGENPSISIQENDLSLDPYTVRVIDIAPGKSVRVSAPSMVGDEEVRLALNISHSVSKENGPSIKTDRTSIRLEEIRYDGTRELTSHATLVISSPRGEGSIDAAVALVLRLFGTLLLQDVEDGNRQSGDGVLRRLLAGEP
jgi:hypothetical protein